MALTTTIITSALPWVNASLTAANDVSGKISDAMVAAGFTLISDVPGASNLSRFIKLKWANCPFQIFLSAGFSYGVSSMTNYIQILGLDGTTVLATWAAGPGGTVTNTDTYMKGGTLRILAGPNTMLLKFISTDIATNNSSFGFLKFNDGNWYLWGRLVKSTLNAGILDNIVNTIHSCDTGVYYPTFLNGSYALIPWLVRVDGGGTIWNPSPLSVYSILPTNFTDSEFYVDPLGKNYFKYGTLMVSD